MIPDMADGPAGVFRMARARRVLRLLRFVQIVRMWKILQSFVAILEKLGKENELAAIPYLLWCSYVLSVFSNRCLDH